MEIELLTGCWNPLSNRPLNDLLYKCMEAVGAPVWTKEEHAFAAELVGKADMLCKDVIPLSGDQSIAFTSTDVADVSWITPVGQIGACTAPAGAPFHTWQFTACAGMSIGQKGMLFAAKVLALAGLRLLKDQGFIERAQEELGCQRGDVAYKAVEPMSIN